MTVFFGFSQTFTTSEETKAGGQTAGRVETTSTYRMPDHILTKQLKNTYVSAPLGGGFSGSGLKLSKSDDKTCTWQDSVYGPTGPLNQPHQLEEVTKSFAWVVDPVTTTPKWVQVAETRTGWGYDTLTQQVSAQTTTKLTRKKVASGFALQPDEMQVKKTNNAGTDWVTTETDTYRWNSKTGIWVSVAAGSGDVSVGGGSRAGGIRSGGGR